MCVTENKEMLSKEAVKVCVCLIVCYIMIQCVSKYLNILVLVKKKMHASREYSVAVGWIKKTTEVHITLDSGTLIILSGNSWVE